MTATQQLVKPTSEVSFNEVARRVVKECLRVQPNEQVIVSTWDHTLQYARALALEVEKAGGVSTFNLEDNDFYWSYLKDVPEIQYTRPQKAYLGLLDQTDAIISLEGPEDPSNYSKLPEGRLAKMNAGLQPIEDKITDKKIRSISLPLGIITRERAKTYGFNFENWLRIFNNSLNVDYSRLARIGEKFAKKIEHGKNARITSSNGTDLKFRLKGRPVHIRDGILDQADLQRGTISESLPAGVIENAPDEASAEGIVQFDQPAALAGKVIKGLRHEFENGHLTKYSAQENVDTFRNIYENATGDKDRIGSLAIGINPRAEPIGFSTDRLVEGFVSIAIGGNSGIGGENNNPFANEGNLRRATLEIDGEKLVADGKIIPGN